MYVCSKVRVRVEVRNVVLQSCNESVVKKAALLADMHLRSLRQKMTLLQLTEESAKKLEVIFVSSNNCVFTGCAISFRPTLARCDFLNFWSTDILKSCE